MLHVIYKDGQASFVRSTFLFRSLSLLSHMTELNESPDRWHMSMPLFVAYDTAQDEERLELLL